MIFFVVALVALACAAATLGPLRSGAVCTPATHRARQVLALVAGSFALFGFGRFVYFVLWRGHSLGVNVAIGQTISVVFAVQAWLLARSVFPRRSIALILGVGCAAIGVLALVRGIRAI